MERMNEKTKNKTNGTYQIEIENYNSSSSNSYRIDVPKHVTCAFKIVVVSSNLLAFYRKITFRTRPHFTFICIWIDGHNEKAKQNNVKEKKSSLCSQSDQTV